MHNSNILNSYQDDDNPTNLSKDSLSEAHMEQNHVLNKDM